MFKIKTDAQSISESTGGGKFIGSSGIYDVSINFASIATSKNGAEQIVFNVKYNDNDQTIYGPWYKSTAGEYLEIGTKLYTTLGVIAGLGDGDEFTVETETHKVGKDQKDTDLEVIQELTDLPVKMQIQAEYSVYENNIQEKMVIRSFFREDSASAEEIVNDGEIGKRLAMIEEKYASNVSYKDGLTEESVAEWIAGGRGKGNGGSSTPAPKRSAGAKSGSLFKKK